MKNPRVSVISLWPCAAIRRFKDESGGTTAMGLMFFLACCMVAGVAVDATNAFREREQLVMAADSAAHAGIVSIALRRPESEIRAAVLAAIEENVPVGTVGETIGDATTDIELVNYDPYSRTVTSGGTANAVRVTLHRDETVSNPVRNKLLQLVGVEDFPFDVTSVAYYGPPGKCSSSDGIYAKGKVSLSSQNWIGPRYCVHSQTQVWMPQQNTFMPKSGVSMPRLEMCKGKCVNSANPGIEEALFQMNLNLPSVSSHIQSVSSQLSDTTQNKLKSDFFANKPLDTDLAPLKAAGINTGKLGKGSVVSLTKAKFDALTRIPTGLVYNVSCLANGNGPNTELTIGGGVNGDILRSVALITNCSINVAGSAKIDNALVITTRTSSTSVINASEGAVVGDPLKNCDLSKKVYIMADAGVSVPADFTASNVSIVASRNIHIAANSSSSIVTHNGTSLHSEGEISLASSHTFNPCSVDNSGLLPNLSTIKLVMPVGL
jgi:Flp pilus assembly protein TadG